MNENKFWEIIEKNKLQKNLFNGHDFLINLCGDIIEYEKKDIVKFLSILDSKFYALYTKKHFETLKLIEMSNCFGNNENNQLVFDFLGGQSTFNNKYDLGFYSDTIRIRFNIICDGQETYMNFLSNPIQILKHKNLLVKYPEDSIFRVREYVYKMYDLGYKNYGTFERELEIAENLNWKINYGNYEENFELFKNNLKDYSLLDKNIHFEDVLSKDEIMIVLISKKNEINYYDNY